MNRSLLASCALAVCLASCLENEEEITVHPDGTVSVRMSAKGQPSDLADGHPIPLHAPWIADSVETAAWIRNADAATSSALAQDELTLAVRADFASANDVPRWLAPQAEPYPTAYLERATSLSIESKSGRRVYAFARVFHGRSFEAFSLWKALEQRMPDELQEKLDKLDEDGSVEITADERERLIELGTAIFMETSIPYARNALLSVYTAGDASLDPRAVSRVVDGVRDSLAAVVNRPRIASIVDRALAVEKVDDEIERLEADARASLRSSLDSALVAEGVPVATRNAIRGQLEWTFTAFDHTTDLGDEKFQVTVRMPGLVVGGNFDEQDGSSVIWRFDGEDLNDRDRVLRVVSVLD